MDMIKVLGFIMTVGGAIALVMGVLGIFGSVALILSPWALTILGIIFFIAGISLLKYRTGSRESETEKNQN